MKRSIDWEAVHQDWQASGLSKNRYFLSGRIEKFIREGVAPCYSTFVRHLRVLEKGQAISQGSSVCVSTPARNNRTVAVHRLTPADIRKATASTAAISTRAPIRRIPTPVKVFFANGTSLEFCSESPEQFAFQALAMGGRFS